MLRLLVATVLFLGGGVLDARVHAASPAVRQTSRPSSSQREDSTMEGTHPPPPTDVPAGKGPAVADNVPHVEHAVYEAIRFVQSAILMDKAATRLRDRLKENMRQAKLQDWQWKQRLRRAIHHLREIQQRTEAESKRLIQEQAPEHLRRVLISENGVARNILAMRLLVKEIAYPDEELPERVLEGFDSIGNTDRTGIWELDPRAQPATEEEVRAFLEAGVTLRTVKPSGFDDKLLDKVLEEQLAFAKKGWLIPVEAADLKCQPAYTFPKDESTELREKVRTIIDSRTKNGYSVLTEKLQLYGTRVLQEILAGLMAPVGAEGATARAPVTTTARGTHARMQENLQAFTQWKKEGEQHQPATREQLLQAAEQAQLAAESGQQHAGVAECGSEDFAHACHQMGVRRPEHCPVGVWSNRHMAYLYFLAVVLNFGCLHSVPNWCRIAEFVMHIGMHFGLIVIIYVDDGYYFALDAEGAELSRELYRQIARTLGLVLSDKPSAQQISTAGNYVKALGIDYRWLRAAANTIVRITVPAETIAKALAALDAVVEQVDQGKMQLKAVQRLLGIANYVVCNAGFRAGSELFRHLYDWAEPERFERMKGDRKQRRQLLTVIGAVRALLQTVVPVIISKQPRQTRTAFLWLDASTDGSPQGTPMGGAVLVAEGEIHALSYIFPLEEIREWWKHNLTIEHYEIMMVRVAQQTWAHLLTNALVYGKVDNAGELFALVKCSGKSQLTANIAANAACAAHHLRMATWWEYVRSELNISDPYSRHELTSDADRVLKPKKSQPAKINWRDEFAPPNIEKVRALAGPEHDAPDCATKRRKNCTS